MKELERNCMREIIEAMSLEDEIIGSYNYLEGEDTDLQAVLDVAIKDQDVLAEVYYDGSGMNVVGDNILGTVIALIEQKEEGFYDVNQIKRACVPVAEILLKRKLEQNEVYVVSVSSDIVDLLRKTRQAGDFDLSDTYNVIMSSSCEDNQLAVSAMLALRIILGYGDEFKESYEKTYGNLKNELPPDLNTFWEEYEKILSDVVTESV